MDHSYYVALPELAIHWALVGTVISFETRYPKPFGFKSFCDSFKQHFPMSFKFLVVVAGKTLQIVDRQTFFFYSTPKLKMNSIID